jgi:hypothetical protein
MSERRRPQQHGVDDAEDRGVEADADRQRQDHHGAESGTPAQHAQGVADVLPQLIDPDRHPDGACVLFDPCDAAEGFERLGARIRRRHAASDVVLGLAFDVIADVVVEILQAAASGHLSTRT